MAALCIGALAVEIRDIIAQSVGLGNAAPLATHFAISPYCPLCYSNQRPILPQQTLIPTIRPITPPSSGPITIAGPATAPRTTNRSKPLRSMTSTSCSPSSARIGISSTGAKAPSISSASSSSSRTSPPGACLPVGPRRHR